MNKMKTYTHKLAAAVTVACFAVIFSACNKDFENKLKDSNKIDTAGINTKTRKVLYIIVDGVRGKVVRNINAPNLAKIAKNSIYAYDALSDYDKNTETNAGSWANMLTGVTKDKHAVTTENFAGNNLSSYPSIFKRFKLINPALRTAAITASASFANNLAADATAKLNFENNDLSVKNAVKEELKRDDASIIVAQFHSAEVAGLANGYLETSPQYVNAIFNLDTYIGELMTSLSSRKTFADENWLVVVASNKGGVIPADPNSTDFTSYGDATRNNFIMFYNPRFSTLFVPKPDSDKIPYNSNGFVFNYNTRPIAIITDVSKYNFGVFPNITIEMLIKNPAGNHNYGTFFSKRAVGFTGAGFNMFFEGNKWTLNPSVASQVQGEVISDGQWHKITAVFDGVNKKVRAYTDGILNTERDMNGNDMNNTSPLKVGYLPGNETQSPNALINSLQIYNVALTSADIANYACKTIVAPTNPNYSKLIGYWPMNEGAGKVINEVTGKGSNFTISGNGVWEAFNDISPKLCPEISDAFFVTVPNNVDIPYQIYQWMSVPIPSVWGLQGKTWNPVYSDIKP